LNNTPPSGSIRLLNLSLNTGVSGFCLRFLHGAATHGQQEGSKFFPVPVWKFVLASVAQYLALPINCR